MPIDPKKYPPDWPEIAEAKKEAAGWRCERCKVRHNPAVPGHTLTVHHRDGDPMNCSPENLLAACQRCHLKLEPAARRQRNRRIVEKEQITMGFVHG